LTTSHFHDVQKSSRFFSNNHGKFHKNPEKEILLKDGKTEWMNEKPIMFDNLGFHADNRQQFTFQTPNKKQDLCN